MSTAKSTSYWEIEERLDLAGEPYYGTIQRFKTREEAEAYLAQQRPRPQYFPFAKAYLAHIEVNILSREKIPMPPDAEANRAAFRFKSHAKGEI